MAKALSSLNGSFPVADEIAGFPELVHDARALCFALPGFLRIESLHFCSPQSAALR